MSQLWAGGADAKMSDEATKGAAKVVSSRLLNLTPLSSRRLKGSRWLRCSREAEFEDLSSRLLSCWVLEVVQGSRWLQSSSVFFLQRGGRVCMVVQSREDNMKDVLKAVESVIW